MTVNRNTGGENGEGLNEMSKHQEVACQPLEDHPLKVLLYVQKSQQYNSRN